MSEAKRKKTDMIVKFMSGDTHSPMSTKHLTFNRRIKILEERRRYLEIKCVTRSGSPKSLEYHKDEWQVLEWAIDELKKMKANSDNE
jgi:hypothetical protein